MLTSLAGETGQTQASHCNTIVVLRDLFRFNPPGVPPGKPVWSAEDIAEVPAFTA